MSFAFPLLLWFGIPLLAVTLAIHLLNLRRQKPVRWAAMDFLLESERINRTWINLKQWLLLALRLLILALAVFALARPQLDKFQIAGLTDNRVLHIIVLDDSYSMSDSGANSSTWDDALAAVDRVLAFAANEPGQQVALLRTSQPEGETFTAEDAAGISSLRSTVADWKPTQLAGSFPEALSQAAQVAQRGPAGVKRIAYLITDGRQRDAEPIAQLAEHIATLQDSGAAVRWVACAAQQNANLTITDLSLLPGPQTAGVELSMQVTVANHGPAAVSEVLVEIDRDGRSSPAIDVGAIPAGQTATRRFAVRFAAPGDHRVTARLEPDSIAADNVRYASFTLAEERSVLLIDRDDQRQEGAPYAVAMRPNKRLNTGWNPKLVSATEAVNQTDFSSHAAVFLLDVERLSDETAEALLAFVERGGGLFISLGRAADRHFYNQWLMQEAARPVLPTLLTKPVRPPIGKDRQQGDMVVSDHPLFRVFRGKRNSFLNLVDINYCYGVQPIEDRGTIHVLATHSSGAPLLVEQSFGKGAVILMLTTAGQTERRSESWSNLSALPVFPVFALELAAHVAHGAYQASAATVGDGWNALASAEDDARVRIGRLDSSGASVLLAEARGTELVSLPKTDAAGFFQINTESTDKIKELILAVNVAPEEGDLRLAPTREFAAMLDRLGVPRETAVALSTSSGDQGPWQLPPLLGLLAISLLLGEQVLAVSASYHEPRKGGQA